MATRAQIGRLAQRIEQVAGHVASHRPRLVARIIHDPRIDETEDAALNRHFEDNPADRQATDLIVLKIVDPIPQKGQGLGSQQT